MRFTAATILAMAGVASAHTRMWSVWVNGEDQGDGRDTYIRSPPNNDPVKDLSKPDIACNVNGAKAVSKYVSAAAGDKVDFEWYHDNRSDDIIATSHLGPIITYIAADTSGDGTGAIWSKIAEDGYDGSKWAVDRLWANKGKASFTIPESLKAGKYLIRQEIIAHHESETAYTKNPNRGAQFYPSCVQVDVTSGGSAVPDQAFDFNTGYTYADPGIVFNIYSSYSSYKIPGPAVWNGSGSGGGASPAPTSSAAAPAPTSTGGAAQPTATATPTFTSVIVTTAAPQPTNGGSSPGNGGNNGGNNGGSASSAPAPKPTKAPGTCTKRTKRAIRGGARPQL